MSEYSVPHYYTGNWARTNFESATHPIVKRFRLSHRCRVFTFIALSMRFGQRGIVTLYDDEIADSLELPSVAAWMKLREQFLLHHVCRIVTTEEQRIYEINPALLVQQDPDQRRADCFSPRTWTHPSELPDGEYDEEDDIRSIFAEELPKPERARLQRNARQAYFKACKKARTAGQADPNRTIFVADYLRRQFEDAALDLPETGNAPGENSATQPGNGNAPSSEITDQIHLKDQHQQGNGNAAKSGNAVTDNETSGVTVPPQPEQPAADVLVNYLFSLGIWRDVCESAAAKLLTVNDAARYIDWIRSQNPDSLPKMFAWNIDRDKMPDAVFVAKWNAEQSQHQNKRRRDEREQDEKAEVGKILSEFEANLSPAHKKELHETTLLEMKTRSRTAYDAYNKNENGVLGKGSYATYRRDVLLRWLHDAQGEASS